MFLLFSETNDPREHSTNNEGVSYARQLPADDELSHSLKWRRNNPSGMYDAGDRKTRILNAEMVPGMIEMIWWHIFRRRDNIVSFRNNNH